MEVRFHRRVQGDLDEILKKYYEISRELGEDFFAEFQIGINKAIENPQRFHFDRSGFDAVIWITSCTTFAEILFAFGCWGTTIGTPILGWNASLNSGLEPGCFSGRADRPLFRIQNHRGRATEQHG